MTNDNAWEAAVSFRKEQENIQNLYPKLHKLIEDNDLVCPVCEILCCSDDCTLAILSVLYNEEKIYG